MKDWRVLNKEKHASYMKYYCRKNREHINIMQRVHRIKRLYGLTDIQYQELLKSQNGGCGICGKIKKKYNLSVDHDHKTGKIRGLLCSPCNRALGILGDSSEALQKVLRYLNNLGGFNG